MMLTELKQWKSEGDYLITRLSRHRVFYKEVGSSDASPENTLLLLHGFPESSFSYHKILKGMSVVFDRIILFDMPGYGLSDKPVENYSYSLFEQADVALQVWRQLGVSGGHLLSHDMGDSVATELAARYVSGVMPGWFSAGFQSFTFTNGSMVLDLADLRVTQKILLSRLGRFMGHFLNVSMFRQQVRSAHGNGKISERDIELLWDNIRQQDGQKKSHLTIQYINDRKRFEKTRWLPSLARLKKPVHICWGEDDSVARVEVARYLKNNVCPDATLTIMPETGHFCQLGNPEEWIRSVKTFY